jgi:hypothetical protein
MKRDLPTNSYEIIPNQLCNAPKCIFMKLMIPLFQPKEIQGPALVQFSGVFSCTLSRRTQKKIFGYECDISVANLPEKRVEAIDRSRYTR